MLRLASKRLIDAQPQSMYERRHEERPDGEWGSAVSSDPPQRLLVEEIEASHRTAQDALFLEAA